MAKYELSINRIINATPEKIWQAWTKAEILELWFCPKPWHVKVHELDVRVGGASRMTMYGPNAEEFPNDGVYLAVEPNKRLVFTDAFTKDWMPSARAFFVGEILLEDLGDGTTKYIATARHWTEEAMKEHEQMGFHEGWNICATQMEEIIQDL